MLPVPKRVLVDRSFGLWLKQVRGLTGMTQEGVAEQSRISLEAIRRLEQGQLPGTPYLVALLAWLNEQRNTDMHQEFSQWPTRVLTLGAVVRKKGLALQPPKSGRKKQKPTRHRAAG
jgi:transcriptional regulator with XRE-family HTH domain